MSVFFNMQGDFENNIQEQLLLSSLRNSMLFECRESFFTIAGSNNNKPNSSNSK